jgi:hypothetical protein
VNREFFDWSGAIAMPPHLTTTLNINSLWTWLGHSIYLPYLTIVSDHIIMFTTACSLSLARVCHCDSLPLHLFDLLYSLRLAPTTVSLSLPLSESLLAWLDFVDVVALDLIDGRHFPVSNHVGYTSIDEDLLSI